MAFQIKDFASITASCINWMRSTQTKVTDFNVGSVVRTMLEAAAIEIEELYLRMFIGIREAIPVSVYNTFGFDALPATAASGMVRFSTGVAPAAATIIIPAGTVLRVPGGSLVYLTQAEARITIGTSHIDVLAACQTVGAIGNTDANTITEVAPSVSGVASVTNLARFASGRDLETEDERLVRFRAYIATLSRGTKAAIVFGVKTATIQNSSGLVTEYVAHANVVEPWLADSTQPISLVKCYIHNGSGSTSGALVTLAQNVIDGYVDSTGGYVPGWKAAGVVCDVVAATDQSVNITATLTLQPGADPDAVVANATAAVANYIQGRNVGESVLESEVIAIIMRDVDGVFNVDLAAPTADVAVAGSAKAVPGTINITTA